MGAALGKQIKKQTVNQPMFLSELCECKIPFSKAGVIGCISVGSSIKPAAPLI